MFKKLKIKSKLLLGFASVAILSAIIGIAGITQLRKIDSAGTELFKTVTVPLGYTTEIASYFQRVRVNVREVFLAENPEEQKKYLARIAEIDALWTGIITEYENAIYIPQAINNLKEVKAAKRQYMEHIPEIEAHLNNNYRDSAMALVRTDMQEANVRLQNALDVLVEYNITAGQTIAEDNTKLANQATIALIVILAFSIIVALVLAFTISFNIQSIIQSLIRQAKMLVDSAVAGKLDTRGDPEKVNFEVREIVVGVNQTLDAVIGPLNVAAEYVDRISKGDIPPKITDSYNGDFNEIKNNLNSCIDAMNELLADSNMLVAAAVDGKLNTRADASRHQGDFKGVVDGVNKTLDVLVGLLDNMPAPAMIVDREFTIRYMNEAGAGLNNKKGKDLVGTKCYDHFRTKDCKTDNCACGKAMSSGQKANSETNANPGNLNLEISYSGVPIRNGKGEVIGAFEVVSDQTEVKRAMRRAEKINAYQAVEADKLTNALDKFSKGDLSFRLETETSDEDTHDARTLFDTINLAVNNTAGSVKALISDADMLAVAAVDGRLATRANAEKHQGDFRKIVEGVNSTLDAVIGPLNVAADYVARISVGDMPEVITDKYNGDFNNIKNNLNVMIEALNEIIGKAQLVAGGDLTVDLKKRSENDELMQSLTDMVKATANIISEFQTAANNISASSQQMSSTSQQMSQGATEQASSAEEVSSSMEEMAANIQQNTDNAQQTEKIALNAAEGINKVNDAAGETLRYMQDIAEKVSIIGEIARQTNILALNAAVEAARAGEHGKGFAVVAAEVRKLAERSQISAVEIDLLTKNSVKATDESGKLLAAIAPEIGKTAKLVQEIAAASIEQNSGADQVNNAIQQLNQVTQQNAAASEEMATSSEELAGQAEALLEMISFFKLENDSHNHQAKKKPAEIAQQKPEGRNGSRIGATLDSIHRDMRTPYKKGAPAPTNGVHLNMGKDHLDSGYEKF